MATVAAAARAIPAAVTLPWSAGAAEATPIGFGVGVTGGDGAGGDGGHVRRLRGGGHRRHSIVGSVTSGAGAGNL
ncbi:hypothetical protein [Streptomyces sp. NPDC001815]|uniref:hypothetical protein n=1 Tax=Streptomyces sp. NPDC001815 TaxID=3154526 RepID=UPI00331C7CD8